jgi:membrane-associated phospholipid phosphatase
MQRAPGRPRMSSKSAPPQPPSEPPEPPEGERRRESRGPLSGPRDALYSILRLIARHVRGFWGAIAAFLTVGMVAGLVAASIFAVFAALVGRGLTQTLDERTLRWVETHRSPMIDEIMLEVTSLGNGAVLVMLVAVASVFLWLTKHHWSVYILLVGVIGGQILNNALKVAFARPRPSIVDAIDQVSSQSFPSGHAMAAIIAYGSVGYLVARLEPTRRLRRATWTLVVLMVIGIGGSRVYLGVHYPSDVLAGFLAGLAWLLFVASSVTAVRFFAPRRPETEVEERGLHVEEERAAGVSE